MRCQRCARVIPDDAMFCQECGWSVGSAPDRLPAPRPGRSGRSLNIFSALFVVAILTGVGLGAYLSWSESPRAKFTIVDHEVQWTASGDIMASVTVENIGRDTGWVTVVCKVTFGDGWSAEDSQHVELVPDEVYAVELLVPVPYSHMNDGTGEYEIYLE